MGLFGSIGKAFKKAVGGVAKVAGATGLLGVAKTAVLNTIPGGGWISKGIDVASSAISGTGGTPLERAIQTAAVAIAPAGVVTVGTQSRQIRPGAVTKVVIYQ